MSISCLINQRWWQFESRVASRCASSPAIHGDDVLPHSEPITNEPWGLGKEHTGMLLQDTYFRGKPDTIEHAARLDSDAQWHGRIEVEVSSHHGLRLQDIFPTPARP